LTAVRKFTAGGSRENLPKPLSTKNGVKNISSLKNFLQWTKEKVFYLPAPSPWFFLIQILLERKSVITENTLYFLYRLKAHRIGGLNWLIL